ncbi:MAG: bactofilin family protein [Sinimarinibacterium flocculans]|uniref:Cytoskeletal protein CcmA (Bactofilin family) n=1 Tax=Sinimarinibacterium flocculans TaxID=985250 RepID=A0A318ED55_9GAMM|nr:polymer-forming cytoskeletal protein [Sinimarinibacterium flocculans]PXV70433.1 cytoskeletal protein CcmA (bactofilin family) [Sinimarinibacterium flocculans]
MFGGNSGNNSSSKSSTSTSVGVDTLIGRQTEILGDVRFTGGLHVDGKIKGKVIASADKAAALSVSEHGSIEGDVRVPNVVLNGTVTGDVHASQKIALSAKARITGNVFYRIIEMESGSKVNGQLVHDDGTGASENFSGGTAAKAEGGSDPQSDELSEARRVKGIVNG